MPRRVTSGQAGPRPWTVQWTLFLAYTMATLGGAAGDVRAEEISGPPKGWRLAFEETFDEPGASVTASGRWGFAYPDGSRTNRGNREMEYYVDPRPGRDAEEMIAKKPFDIVDGVLAIRATKLASAERRASLNLPYASGMLTTHNRFAFRYGYAEIRARMPRGRGLWPAFWLLAQAGGWPPEIDVLEAYGDRLDTLYVTAHTSETGRHRQLQRKVPTPDLSAAFHVYGVRWTEETIVWFFDGEPVYDVPTPADFKQPMFLLVNLAVGGTSAGAPDAETPFPSAFEIDHIRVYLPLGTPQPEAAQ